MSNNTLTLDELFAAVREEYQSFEMPLGDDLGTVSMVNPIRLSKEDRKVLKELTKELSSKNQPEVNTEKLEDETDEEHAARVEAEEAVLEEYMEGREEQMRETIRSILRLTADNKSLINHVFNRIGEDTAAHSVLIKRYFAAVKPGEA